MVSLLVQARKLEQEANRRESWCIRAYGSAEDSQQDLDRLRREAADLRRRHSHRSGGSEHG